MTGDTVARSSPVDKPAEPVRVWPALARRESGFTLRHPVMWVGVLASLYLLWSFNLGEFPHLGGYSTYVGLGLAPLAGASLLVAHLQTSRAQRHDTLEIEEPAPAQQRARTVGHLIGSLASVPIAVVIITGYMVYLYLIGGTGRPDIGELLIGVLVVAMAAIAGVAAGTWFPNRFGGLIGLGGVAVVQIALQDAPGTMHWFSWWHTVLWYGGFDLWIRPTWAHVVYMVGAAALIGAVASLRHGLRTAPVVIAAGGLALLVGGGLVQAQPPTDAEVDEVWNRVANPAASWATVERGSVSYRVQPSYQRWIDWWDDVITDTMAPIAAVDRPALVVEQRPHAFPSQLLDEFRGESDPAWLALMDRANELYFATPLGDPWPIQVGETLSERSRAPLAIAAALRAADLPLVPVTMEGRLYTEDEIAGFNYQPTEATEYVDWPGRELGLPRPVLGDRWTYQVGCSAEGQAREIVAAWLAAQSSPALADLYSDIRLHGPNSTLSPGEGFTEYWSGDESITPAVLWDGLGWVQHEAGIVGVLGSPTATDLAAQLLDRPHAEVTAAIRQHWDEWTDPATPAQAIIDTFSLELPATPAQWIERGGEDPADYAASIAAYPHRLGNELAGFDDQSYPVCP